MERETLEILCQWESQKSRLFLEIEDLTGQLAGAMGRKDQISLSMLLNMRQDAIQKAQEIAGKAQGFILALPEEDAARAAGLLKGDPAERAGEERLALLVGQNREKLSKILEEDKRLSLQLGGRHSFYEKFRE